MRARLATSSLLAVDTNDLNSAATSLRHLEFLTMTEWEREFHDVLVKTVEHAYERPVEAYTAFVVLYNLPSRWTHDEFQSFIDPNNNVAQILLAHFIAIQAVLTPILTLERVGFQGVHAPTAVLGWIEWIYRNVPSSLRHHVEWSRQVARYPFMRFQGQGEFSCYD